LARTALVVDASKRTLRFSLFSLTFPLFALTCCQRTVLPARQRPPARSTAGDALVKRGSPPPNAPDQRQGKCSTIFLVSFENQARLCPPVFDGIAKGVLNPLRCPTHVHTQHTTLREKGFHPPAGITRAVPSRLFAVAEPPKETSHDRKQELPQKNWWAASLPAGPLESCRRARKRCRSATFYTWRQKLPFALKVKGQFPDDPTTNIMDGGLRPSANIASRESGPTSFCLRLVAGRRGHAEAFLPRGAQPKIPFAPANPELPPPSFLPVMT